MLATTAMDCSRPISPRRSHPRHPIRAALTALILAGGLAGCSVLQSPQPTPPAENFSALSPILTTDRPYAIPDAPITPENADRLALVGTLAGLGAPRALAGSPDGRLLAVGTARGICLHDAQTLDQRRFLEAPSVKFVSISPDGRLLAAYSADPHKVRVWRLDDGAPVGSLDIQPPRATTIYPAGIAFSPAGEQVYAAYYDFRRQITILAWRPEDESAGREVFEFDPEGFVWLNRLIIAPAYDLVVIALFERVEVHRLSQRQRLFAIEASPEEVRSAALSPDGRQLVVGLRSRKVQLWGIAEGKLLREFVIPEGWIWNRIWASQLTFSPDGPQLMVALYNNVYIWSLDRAEATPSIMRLEPGVEILDAQFSSDPSIVHVLLKDELRNVRTADGTTAQVFSEYLHRSLGIAFSADGQWLAGAFDYRIGLWRVRDGALLRTTASFASEMPSYKSILDDFIPSGPAPVADAVFSSDLQTAIFSILVEIRPFDERGRSGLVQVRSANGALRQTLRGYIDQYARLAISPDGRFLAGGDDDGVVLLWRLSDGLNLRVLRGHREPIVGLAFSPDGRLLVTASRREVKVWEAASGRERQVLHASRDSAVESIALSSTGQRLAVLRESLTSQSGKVAFWEADEVGALNFARELEVKGVQVTPGIGPHRLMTFSPDSRLLALADDEYIYLVDADQASLKRVIKTDSDVEALAFSPDGRLLALATEGSVLLHGVP